MIPLFSFLFHLFSEYRISYSYFLLIHPGIPSSPSPLLTSSCDNIFLDIVTLSLSLVFLAVLYVRVEKKTGFAKGSIPFLEYSIVRFFFVFLSLNTKNLFWTPSSFIYLFFLSFFFLLCFVFFFFFFLPLVFFFTRIFLPYVFHYVFVIVLRNLLCLASLSLSLSLNSICLFFVIFFSFFFPFSKYFRSVIFCSFFGGGES